MFKRSNAIFCEKMNKLTNVTVTEDKVMFKISWSDIEFKPEDVPKLLADVIQLYSLVKPTLEKKQAELDAKKEGSDDNKSDSSDEPINLDDIPF